MIHVVKTRLSKLLDRLGSGGPWQVFFGQTPQPNPGLGSMRGEISWEEGWEAALAAEESDAFLEGR